MTGIRLLVLGLGLFMASRVFAAPNPEIRIALAPSCSGTGAFHGTGVVTATPARKSDDAAVFQAGFDAMTWTGSLKKNGLPGAAMLGNVIGQGGQWDAGMILTGMQGVNGQQNIPPNPLPEARHIYTGRPNANKSLSTVEFLWEKLSDSQKTALNTSPATKKQDGLGAKRVAYLRGNRTLEIGRPEGIFRERTSILGDIVNSTPVYAGEPSLRVIGDGYREFQEQYSSRPRTIYVGANDGMLHAFSDDDGTELFAYVPNALISGLPALTSSAYQHRPYVDGGIDVSEALVGGAWRTVLASGMGGGAQGVFALDVTQPSSFAGGIGAIFEFTDADDPDMGNVMGSPLIAKFRTHLNGGAAEYKYFVVVSAGLNNYRDDGKGLFNKDGSGALFLLTLDKPASEPWKLGTNYYKFRTSSKDASLPNGLATPAVVLGSAGAVRYAYVGDLQGNLWRFDFTGNLPWKGALASDVPLFVAKDKRGDRQPIAMQPRVVFAPGGGYVILFGTGRYFEEADGVPGGFHSQSFYGILDTTEPKYRIEDRSELAARFLNASSKENIDISGAGFEYGVGDGEKKGWYLDFPDSERTGERAISGPQLADGILLFNTLISGSGFCMQATGYSYVLNSVTGLAVGGSTVTVGASIPSTANLPILQKTSANIGERNPVGRRTVRKGYVILDPVAGVGKDGDASGGNRGNALDVVVPAGRLSWREIVNWQELKHALEKK